MNEAIGLRVSEGRLSLLSRKVFNGSVSTLLYKSFQVPANS
jgi:hypothetical protein